MQCKKEEGSAMAYSERVVNKKEMTSRSQVATDNETITVPNNDKHCNIQQPVHNAED
jgi:hypothetical protein